MPLTKRLLAASALAGLAFTAGLAPAGAQTQGVTDTEVLIGSHNDLSGIFAAFGAPAIKAANLYFKEVNDKGGVHGRKIRFIVEDHAYQMPKSAQAVNKLINSDKVFAMLLSLGTPMNIAAFKLQDEKKIPNIAPLTSARQMLDAPADYKFIAFSAYYDQIKSGVTYMKDKQGAKVICSMYIPSDFGLEIQQGAVDQAKKLGLAYGGETTHKGDDADFVGALTKLKEANCDVIAMALGVRQAITVSATVKKMGWDSVKLLGSSAGFNTALATIPGGVTEGLYAAAGWADHTPRLNVPEVKAWADAYRAAYNETAGTGALLGRSAADMLVRGMEAAGKNLTADTLKKGIEGLKYRDVIGDANIEFSPANHQGAKDNIISVIKNGVWVEVARVD